MTNQLTRDQIKLRQGHYVALNSLLARLEVAAYQGLLKADDNDLQMWLIGVQHKLGILTDAIREGGVLLSPEERAQAELTLADLDKEKSDG